MKRDSEGPDNMTKIHFTVCPMIQNLYILVSRALRSTSRVCCLRIDVIKNFKGCNSNIQFSRNFGAGNFAGRFSLSEKRMDKLKSKICLTILF